MGNHEFYGGTNLTRYLDSTWEKWEPIAMEDKEDKEDKENKERWGGEAGLGGYSTATSALGAFLSAGNHHGPGVHATVPSRSSRFFSVDFGLVHFVSAPRPPPSFPSCASLGKLSDAETVSGLVSGRSRSTGTTASTSAPPSATPRRSPGCARI